jgi:putative transcriptional regulator
MPSRTKTKVKINRIKIVLAEKDMSIKELAVKMKKAPTTIYRFCRNERQPSLPMLLEIAKALDVDIRDLLNPSK